LSKKLIFAAVLVMVVLLLVAGCGKKEPAQPPVDPPPVDNGIVVSEFVGSDSCKGCHSDVYSEWETSWHTIKATQGPAFGAEMESNILEWVRNDWDNLLTYMIVDQLDKDTIYVATEKVALEDVDFVVGRIRKQRYATYYDGGPVEVYKATTEDGGISWTLNMDETFEFEGNKERAGYKFLFIETRPNETENPNYYGEWRSWQERCIACHTTGFDYEAWDEAKAEFVAGQRDDLRDIFVADLRVGCEACHGPGSVHASSMKADDIINPAKFEAYEDKMNTCAQCHTRAASSTKLNTANDLRGFMLGDNYSDFANWLTPKWGTGDRNVSIDGKGRRDHQMDLDMRLSRFINPDSYHADQACFDCHSPHRVGNNPDNLRLKDGIAEGCVQCHKDFTMEEALDGRRGWEKAEFPNWGTEYGRQPNKQHLFNLNEEGLVYGLSPEQYHWVLKDGGDAKTQADWSGIWPWNKEAADAAGKTTFVGAEPWNQ